MGITAFIRRFSSISSVLAGSVQAPFAVLQARVALQSGAPERALAIIEKAIADIETREATNGPDAPSTRVVEVMKAGLRVLLAIAGRKASCEPEAARELFDAAEHAYRAILESGKPLAQVFLADYMAMLMDFGALDKAAEMAGILGRIADAAKADGSSVLLRMTGGAQNIARVVDLGAELKKAGRPEAAFDVLLYSSGVALANNDQDGAMKAVGAALEIYPDDPVARRTRGVLRWRLEDIDGARADFAAVVAKNADDIDSRVALAHACLKSGANDEARLHLNFVLDKQPQHPDARWLSGCTQLALGDDAAMRNDLQSARAAWESAIVQFDQAISLNSNHAACLRSRSIALLRLERHSEALVSIDRALELDPDDVEGHRWRAEVLLAKAVSVRNEQGLSAASGAYVETLSAVNVALVLADAKAPSADGRTIPDQTRARLWEIKGYALLSTKWPVEARQALEMSLRLNPRNEDAVAALIRAYQNQSDWEGLSHVARTYQEKSLYSPRFTAFMRKCEVAALRECGQYANGIAAIRRPPIIKDEDTVWLHARLLADIGDFESACETLPPPVGADPGVIDQLSLRGWIIQNLEPHNPDERSRFGGEGRELYEAALEAAQRSAEYRKETMWLRKGLANALKRIPGSKDKAVEQYQQAIAEAEDRVHSSRATPRLLSMLGWSHYWSGQTASALRYYEAACNSGEQSVSTDLDHALILWATSGLDAAGKNGLEKYHQAVERSTKENVHRRIGMLRVALHDLREVEFLQSTPDPDPIRHLLLTELTAAVPMAMDISSDFAKHLMDFLEVVAIPMPWLTTEAEPVTAEP